MIEAETDTLSLGREYAAAALGRIRGMGDMAGRCELTSGSVGMVAPAVFYGIVDYTLRQGCRVGRSVGAYQYTGTGREGKVNAKREAGVEHPLTRYLRRPSRYSRAISVA